MKNIEVVMATITVKNIPDQEYNMLKKLAAAHHRSINREIIYLINKATGSNRIDPTEYMLIARKLREKTRNHVIFDTEISNARNEGR